MRTRRSLRRPAFRPELIFTDDSGAKVRQSFRSVADALAEGQSLAAYGLTVLLRHSPRSRRVRCVA